MSFGSGGGFGFGQQNSQQQSAPFGGFGNNANANTGLGTTTSNTGFGNTTANSNPFGASGGFGSNTGGGFGGPANTGGGLFGNNKPAFGGTSNTGTGGLFGSTNTTNTGFGTGGFGGNTSGFGATNTTTTPSFSFGASTAQPKPAFGGGTGGGLFGQGGTGTTGAFGGGATTSPFGGGGTGTALNQPVGPSEGTGSTPFVATRDKEANGGSVDYQSITFQPPYQKYSFEELRLADYNGGRRYGNGSGQAGAFGQPTFGGFGATQTTPFGSGGGLFGGQQTSTGGFGPSTSTTGFGAGLFGGQKPTGGGLFGSGQQSSATTSGGLFGTSGGFGNNTSQPQQSAGLFGGSQPKSGGLFGTSGGFGANNSQPQQSGGLFGNSGGNAAGSPFGTGSNQAQAGSLFGSSSQANKPGGLFGTSGGFGTGTTQPQQSGGLFGSSGTSTGGGLFGGNNNQNTGQNQGGGLFGSNPTTQSGGLFGNNQQTQQKPGGLFGAGASGGGLFGGGTQQQIGQGGGGLFGGNQQQNQQQPQQQGGLFGGGASGGFGGSNNTGGGIFGGSQQKQGGLFSNSTSNNQGGGSFGASANQQPGGLFANLQPQQQQPQQFHASILDPNPYGQSSIWTGLPAATPQNSGPLATPLTASQRLKESQTKPLPSLRFTSSRYMTPPRRNGYGFSYSTYGSPSSAASTPGGGSLTTSMYGQRFTGGSFGRSVGKSFSASNLRSQFSADGESVLSPGAFTPGSSRYSGGSIRRLTIDRNIKSDLFSRPTQPALPAPNGVSVKPTTNGESNNEQPHKLKKRVSFDTDITGGEPNEHLNGEIGALVRTETDSPESGSADATPLQSSHGGKNGTTSTSSGRDPGRGKELAVVPEDRESDDVVGKGPPPAISGPQEDPEPGEYWMKPSKDQLKKLSQRQLMKVEGFQVGRVRCGDVTFNVPADLTTVPIDDIFDNIVKITLRTITLYEEPGSKPVPGEGLNLPSTLRIENSWPRNHQTRQLIADTSGPLFDLHLRRLKKIKGTHFIEYSAATGVWIFSVDHYTRYALDYDDDDEEEEEENELSSPPATVEQPSQISEMDVDDGSPEDTDQEDDTFAFKQKIVPGGFSRQSAVVDERDEPFLDDGSAAVDSRSEHSYVSEQEESDQEMNMAGSFPQQDGAAEPDQSPVKPILKASQHPWGTPAKPLIDLDGDWAEHLQRTISPRKQNRDALRELQSKVLLDRQNEVVKRPSAADKKEFRTSIDVMNSLFGKHQESMALSRRKEGGSGFEWPYPKRATAFHQKDEHMDEATQAWHESFKPTFTSEGTLLYAQSSMSTPQSADWQDERLLAGEGRDLIESSLKGASKQDPYLDPTSHWRKNVKISIVDGVPFAKHSNTPFSTFVDQMPDQVQSDLDAERQVYQLAHILFDDYEDEFTAGLTSQQKKQLSPRIRKDRLTDFLDVTIARRHYQTLEAKEKKNLEEAALWYLSVHDVNGACNCLIKAKDYHLATLVSQIEQADKVCQGDIAEQIEAWKEQNIISEINEPIRALYELLSGNTTVCEGKQNVPLEDQASTFTISDRFGFDWLQSFGLCLWYGDQKHGTIEKAVEDYRAKIDSSEEPAWPVANAGSTLESPLWVLLKLYTAKGPGQTGPTLPQDLASLTKPFDVRAAFQLHHALAAHIKHARVDTEAADKLAADLAFQLSATGHYIGAAFALLHLSVPSVRKAALKDLLARHAANLPSSLSQDETTPNDDTIIFSIITQDLKIPQQRLHAAKGQYARSRNESTDELRYLLAAETWADAHTCLCRRVAPRIVIDEDWDLLAEMLELFSAKPEEHVGDVWAAGGGIYSDFLALVSGKVKGKEGEIVAKRLSQALEEMGSRFKMRGDDLKAGGSEELEERVACMEMGRLVAGLLVSQGVKGKSVLELPMTADARLRMAREVGGEEYRRLAGGAK